MAIGIWFLVAGWCNEKNLVHETVNLLLPDSNMEPMNYKATVLSTSWEAIMAKKKIWSHKNQPVSTTLH